MQLNLEELAKNLTDRERTVLFAIVNDIPLKDISKYVSWNLPELRNTKRLLVWYLRYVFFYAQFRDYIRAKLEEILVVKTQKRDSKWGRKLVLEMVEFPIRGTGYWARKLGYKLQGNVSGSVLIALFVAENRIESYLENHMEDTILRRWYLLFRAIQFGALDFNRRFRYKSHLFEDLPEWKYIKPEITIEHSDSALKAEIKKLVKRLDKPQIYQRFKGYGIDVAKVIQFTNEILGLGPEDVIIDLWREYWNLEQVFSKMKELDIKVTRATGRTVRNIVKEEVRKLLLQGYTTKEVKKQLGVTDSLLYSVYSSIKNSPERVIACLLREGVPVKELKQEIKKKIGKEISLDKIYKYVKKWRSQMEVVNGNDGEDQSG